MTALFAIPAAVLFVIGHRSCRDDRLRGTDIRALAAQERRSSNCFLAHVRLMDMEGPSDMRM